MNTNTMTLRQKLVWLLLVAFVLAGPQATEAHSGRTENFTFSARDKIQLGKRRVRNKVVLKIVDLNPVRYIYSVNGERVAGADVDLSKLPFLAPIPSAGSPPQQPAASASAAQQSSLDQSIAKAFAAVNAKQTEINDDNANISTLESRSKAPKLSKAARQSRERDLRSAQKKLEDDQQELARLKIELADLLRKKKALDDIAAAFTGLNTRYAQAERDVSGVELKARGARDAVELAKREVDGLISKSNDDIETTLLSRVRTAVVRIGNAIPPALPWPDTESAKAKQDLQSIQSDLDLLPVQFPDGWPEWIKNTGNAAAFKSLGDRVKALLAYLETLKPIRDEWDKQVAKLIDVKEFLTGIGNQGPSAFTRTLLPFDCGSVDDTTIKLKITDRTGAEPKEQEISMVTFECASPLSVSTGFAFSTRDENEFSLINKVKPGTDGGAPTLEQFKVIGSDKRSRFRPIPVLLLNTRIHDFSSDLGLHFSFGAGVDVKTGKTGSDLEFLVGPSLLLKDRFFFTVGAHIGREIRLQDGFKLGQDVPNDLAAAPTFKRYTTGLGIAFSYRVK